MTRRALIVLAGTFTLSGCAGTLNPGDEPEGRFLRRRGPVDAGPLSDYMADGVYDRFRTSHGIFVIREGHRLFAQSAVCTHRDCLLRAHGAGFRCPCHGSTFTAAGHVSNGPARRNLPRFLPERRSDGHFIVHTETPLAADAPESFLTVS